VQNIIGEGLRLAGFCPHVEAPKPPIVNTLNAPVHDPREFEAWIVSTMANYQEANGARLRSSALAIGTIIASLPSDEPAERVYDLRELSEKFFSRWLSHHRVAVNYQTCAPVLQP
jgi:hypothetical protein